LLAFLFLTGSLSGLATAVVVGVKTKQQETLVCVEEKVLADPQESVQE